MDHHIASILLIGFIGSIHCVGMCGGFVLALSQSAQTKKKLLLQQTSYHFGKSITYMMLGVLAGGLGGMVTHVFNEVQYILGIAVGALLVLVGLGILGVNGSWFGRDIVNRWKSFAMALGRQLKRNSRTTGLTVGLLNGLLPCGLVYGALAIATSTASAWKGALLMGIFGLTTIPALLVMAFAGLWIQPAWRNRLNRLSGILVIALGLLTIWRGLPRSAAMHDHSMANFSINQLHDMIVGIDFLALLV